MSEIKENNTTVKLKDIAENLAHQKLLRNIKLNSVERQCSR